MSPRQLRIFGFVLSVVAGTSALAFSCATAPAPDERKRADQTIARGAEVEARVVQPVVRERVVRSVEPRAALAAVVVASPSGSGSVCTAAAPCSLATAFSSPLVGPGTTIVAMPGRYVGRFTLATVGTVASPVVVEGTGAILSAPTTGEMSQTLAITGSYTTVQNFEITAEGTDRTSTQATSWPTDINVPDGVMTDRGTGNKLIGCWLHNLRQGLAVWANAVDFETVGNVIEDVGWNSTADGYHGHGIYTQNDTGRTRYFRDNIIAEPADYGFHAYASDTGGRLSDLTLEGNTLLSDLMIGGGRLVERLVFKDNVTIGGQWNIGFYYWGAGSTGTVMTGNVLNTQEPPSTAPFTAGKLYWWKNVNPTFAGNVVRAELYETPAGSLPRTGNVVHACAWQAPCTRPSANIVRVRTRPELPNRATVAVVNFTGSGTETVSLPFSGTVEVWNVGAKTRVSASASPNLVLSLPGGRSAAFVITRTGGAPSTPVPTTTPIPPTVSPIPPTATASATPTYTFTSTSTPTSTATASPTATVPASPTSSPTRTNTALPTASFTPTRTVTATFTSTPSRTPTRPSVCWTVTPTAAPVVCVTVTPTP